jgi:hypothetical protein
MVIPAVYVLFNRPTKFEIRGLVLFITCVLILGLSDYLKLDKRKIAAFCLLFSMSETGVLLAAWHFWPSFTVVAELMENGTAPYGLAIWNVTKDAAYPVGIATYIRIQNGYPYAEMIDSIVLQIEARDGTWHSLTDMEFGDFYYGNPPTLYTLANIPLLRSRLSNRNLEPGDYESGWLFLDYPKDSQLNPPDFTKYAESAGKVAPGVGVFFEQGYIMWEADVPPYIPTFRMVITDLKDETTIVPVEFGRHRWGQPPPVYLLITNPALDVSKLPIDFRRLSR